MDRRVKSQLVLGTYDLVVVLPSLTVGHLHVSLSGPPTHPHVVKTASIGTLGRTRTPMLVSVPNAPDVPETSKMLEDVDNVSRSPPSGGLSNAARLFWKSSQIALCFKLVSGFLWALDDVV